MAAIAKASIFSQPTAATKPASNVSKLTKLPKGAPSVNRQSIAMSIEGWNSSSENPKS